MISSFCCEHFHCFFNKLASAFLLKFISEALCLMLIFDWVYKFIYFYPAFSINRKNLGSNMDIISFCLCKSTYGYKTASPQYPDNDTLDPGLHARLFIVQ